jgi:hypothetical protein
MMFIFSFKICVLGQQAALKGINFHKHAYFQLFSYYFILGLEFYSCVEIFLNFVLICVYGFSKLEMKFV